MWTKLPISFRGILTCMWTENKIKRSPILTIWFTRLLWILKHYLMYTSQGRLTHHCMVQPSNQVNAALDKHLHTMASKGNSEEVSQLYHVSLLATLQLAWNFFFHLYMGRHCVAQCNYSCCSLTCLLKNTWGDLKEHNTVQLSQWPQSCTYTSQQRSESLVWGESGVVGTYYYFMLLIFSAADHFMFKCTISNSTASRT